MIDGHQNLTGRFSIQMEPELKQWLEEQSKSNSRSLSGEIVDRLRRSRAANLKSTKRRKPK